MGENMDFPPALVEQRAKELRSAAGSERGVWTKEWSEFIEPQREAFRAMARLSLRREVEACEPLVRCLEMVSRGHEWSESRFSCSCHKCESWRVLTAHRARYAPAPETLADVAREAAEALSGNAALSARLLAAVEREKVQP